MACTDRWVLSSESLEESLAFFLTPMPHQGHKPMGVFTLQGDLISPLWIDKILITLRGLGGLNETSIVSKDNHRDPVGYPKTLGLDKSLVKALCHRRVISLEHPLAAQKLDTGVIGVQNISQKGAGLKFSRVALNHPR